MPAFPKNTLSVHQEIERIRNHLGDKLSRPCLIVGNGPSCSEVQLTPEEIGNFIIFRANWFFLEEEKRFGTRVDGFFWSVDNTGLRDRIQEVQRLDQYRIDAFFQPFQPSDSRDIAVTASAASFSPNFDHWAVIASDPTLARFMMGRPLPTQGMQMIAFAAIIGFKEIHLAGIDLYQDTARRYAWNVPDEVKVHLKEKDYQGGYEEKHSIDLDLHFLRAILHQYDVNLVGLSEMAVLAPFLTRSERRCSSSVKREEPSAPKQIYVTLADGRYVLGCMALARSLARLTDIPLLVLHTDPYTPRALRHLPNVLTRQIDPIDNPHAHGQERFSGTFSKLRVFELLEYERVTFIDADCVVLQDIDHLFEANGFLAAPDWGIEIKSQFNSGLFCFSPTVELRDEIFSAISESESDDGGDQGFLNSVLRSSVKILPPEYNTLKRLPVYHPNLININDVKVLHFTGDKPWDYQSMQSQYISLEKIWIEFMEKTDWQHAFWIGKAFTASNWPKPKRKPTKEEKERKFQERLNSYGPVRRALVRWGDILLPASITKPIDRLMKRIGVL